MEINPVGANSVSTSWSYQSQSANTTASLSRSIKNSTAQMAQIAYQLPEALRPAVYSAISDAESSLSSLDAEGLKELAAKLIRMYKMMQDLAIQQMMLEASSIGALEDEEDTETDPLIDVSSATQSTVIDSQTEKLMELLYDSPLGYDKLLQQQKQATIEQSLNTMLGLNSNS